MQFSCSTSLANSVVSAFIIRYVYKTILSLSNPPLSLSNGAKRTNDAMIPSIPRFFAFSCFHVSGSLMCYSIMFLTICLST